MGFSRQEYWSGLPFFSPVDHILSDLSIMTHPSKVALHAMAYSFIELDKTVIHVIRKQLIWGKQFSIDFPKFVLSFVAVLVIQMLHNWMVSS